MKNIINLVCIYFIITLFVTESKSQLVWNNAAKLEGNEDSYIAIPNTSSLPGKFMSTYLHRAVTAECWVFPDNSTQPQKQMIFQKAAGNNPVGFALYLNQGKPSVKVNNIHVLSTVSQIPSQKWSHLAIVYNNIGSTWSIYINGILQVQQFYSFNKIANTDSLYIGKGSENPFKGYIDEFRLWTAALPAADISRNFRTSLATYSGFNSNYFQPNDLNPNGAYTGLLISLPFQDDEQLGTVFSLSDWSACGFNAKGNGITPLNLSHRPSTTIFQNECAFMPDTLSRLMGKDNIYNSPTTHISMETWFYNNDFFPTPYMGFILKGNDYSLGIRWDFTGYNLVATVNSQDMTPPQSIVINFIPKHKWIHLGFTYNSVNGEYKYYLNGELYFTGNKPAGPVNNGSDSLRIGNKHKGWIDEVRISDYVKSESEIKENAFRSIDRINAVNPAAKNLNYSLDGYSVDNLGQGGTTLFFRGNARFSAPSTLDNIPVSPINRHDASDYYNTFVMSGYLGVRIPDAGFGGTTVSAIQVTAQPKTVINDVNVFVALNHEKEQDLKMYLVSPYGDTIIIYNGTAQLGTNDNIITIFDDEADSSLSMNKFTSIGPVIKPHKPVSAYLNGKSPAGEWKLLIKDNGSAADIGILYNWGLQFNNGVPLSRSTGDNNSNNTPYSFSLEQNYPNPFNPVTNINFSVPFKTMVTLVVYDVTGREIKKLVNEEKTAGKFNITFDASSLSSGAYFYKLNAGGFEEVKRMILVK